MSSEVLTLHLSEYRAAVRQPPHWHGELHLSMVLHGGFIESACGDRATLRSLDIVSKDPGLTHADEWSTEGAVVARLSIRDRGLSDLSDRRAPQPWTRSQDVSAAAPFLRLVSRARSCRMDVSTDDADVSDLVAALTARRAEVPSGQPPAWLREVAALITEGWHPGITVREVANHTGVHPVYLARCVRRWYGVSVGDTLRAVRLRHAVGALGATEEPVSRVAHASGFSDEPHLSRSIRRVAGVTPANLRNVLHTARRLARPAGVRQHQPG